MKILYLIEKYCDANPASGPTNAESMVIGAISSTGLVKESKRFYYDVLCKQFGREKMMELLLEDCQVFKPDLIVYTPMGGLLGLEVNPLDGWIPDSLELLAELHRKGIKVYSHLWDTIGRDAETLQRNVAVSDLCGDVASNADRFSNDKIIQVWSAVDPKDFFHKGLRRDIDVCFIGAVDLTGQRWPQRIKDINFLQSKGVRVNVSGGQRQNRISWEEYSNLLNRSKISLNWSKDLSSSTSQLKGRVFESLSCGAMLLEDHGDQTCRFFEPGKDFVIFSSQEDLYSKVGYYLNQNRERERESIARSGWEKVTRLYNARNMWGDIFQKMGFEILI